MGYGESKSGGSTNIFAYGCHGKRRYYSPNLYVDIFERKQGIRIVRLMERYEPHGANIKDDYTLIKSAAENDKSKKQWLNG